MKIQTLKVCVLSFGLLLGISAESQTLKIPLGQQGDQHIERPHLGMSKAAVEAKYGEPQDWTEAKGQPPISSWEYELFVVYFENDSVIHSVIKHKAVK